MSGAVRQILDLSVRGATHTPLLGDSRAAGSGVVRQFLDLLVQEATHSPLLGAVILGPDDL